MVDVLSHVTCLNFWGGHGWPRSGGVSLHVVGNVRYPLVMFIGVFDGFSSSLAYEFTILRSVFSPLFLACDLRCRADVHKTSRRFQLRRQTHSIVLGDVREDFIGYK